MGIFNLSIKDKKVQKNLNNPDEPYQVRVGAISNELNNVATKEYCRNNTDAVKQELEQTLAELQTTVTSMERDIHTAKIVLLVFKWICVAIGGVLTLYFAYLGLSH